MTALHVRRSWDGNLGDLPLTRIFELLADAPSFARCRAVCKSWRAAAATLDDRPATRAALSTAEDEDDAAEDIVRACMSHSFEPTHGMLFVGLGFDLTSFAERVLRRTPRRGGRPMPLVACLSRMELCGFRVHAPAVRAAVAPMAAKQKQLEEDAYRLAGRRFKFGSAKDIGRVLFDELQLGAGGL